MAELQKDPITRSDFLGFGAMGVVIGAILTIPPAAYLLQPVIQADFEGKTDVSQRWIRLGSIEEIPHDTTPKLYKVSFPISQIYGSDKIQKESGVGNTRWDVENAVYVSWKAPIIQNVPTGVGPDKIGKSQPPGFVLHGLKKPLSQEQIKEAEQKLNVMSSSCAHLGCPVRWIKDQQAFLCPCHGGLYDINGNWMGGPPPRGLYHMEHRVDQDGVLYVRHKYVNVGGKNGFQRPFVA